MPATPLARHRGSFLAKLVAIVLIVATADLLFYGHEPGWTLGLFAFAWTAAEVTVVRGTAGAVVRRGAIAAAIGFAAVLVDDPSPLAILLFLGAIVSAAVAAKARFTNAVDWALRLAVHGLFGLSAPVMDARRLAWTGSARGNRLASLAATLVLPLVGGALFVLLFASANPIVANALGAVELPGIEQALLHLILWGVVTALAWPTLRPRARSFWNADTLGAIRGPEVPHATLLLSLVVFNAIFAVENALDIAFLWSGAPLPGDVTMADYAHRGAYSLIATAILAGLFVLVALRPGSDAARSPAIRRLVVLWIGQNLLLVASSVLRTLDYIDAYSLTVLRLAALAWMALVAVGLVLICWRMLAGRSAAWLVNANAAAALAVLAAASVVDLGATAATWNVAHARRGDDLDLCYLGRLGPSALLPLIELERRAGGPVLRDRARYLRTRSLDRLALAQSDSHSWTWRGARRLSEAKARLATMPAGPALPFVPRRCDGSPRATPLTAGAAR